jgi:hypothetical protein
MTASQEPSNAKLLYPAHPEIYPVIDVCFTSRAQGGLNEVR